MNKKGFEFSFAWIFAIIVGAVVLFLAIYAASSFINTSRFETDTKIGAQLGIILNPVETNLEESKYVTINFPDETRVFNNCRNDGNFGRQGISTAVRSDFGKEFGKPGVEINYFNKYVFSDKVEEGKKLHVFVKSFDMPYKVADLIIISSENYCFVSPPDEIYDEIADLNMDNVEIVFSVEDCRIGIKSVCFISGECDINVNHEMKFVVKDGRSVYYEDDLVFGAIFADTEIYECQVQRLMKRSGELAHVYAAKTEFLSSNGCSSNLRDDLIRFGNMQIEDSSELRKKADFADDLGGRNDLLSCKLF